ncbi:MULTISPECIES: IclR family transcriptional regulator [Burkholderia]|uniref:IclR family transcriptional regulator n=1 Tax=Burkholderia paludis TaxID=1506587 RepID=A0A6J5DHY0_9BURK|nr:MULTISPECIES: IclR family transcriptional regulator [Burkholderia]CAB3753084.1 Pca regulon regulatory protein [Burkholderia paludis]VWB65273.1 IclR family transcriptional regulator [Burkholderia paludis]
MATKDNLYVQSLARGLELLEAFSTHDDALSLGDLAKLTGLDRSATQRLAHTLVLKGYLERKDGGRGLVLGKAILARSFDFLRSSSLIERATPLLNEIQKQAGERVDLSLFDDTFIIYALRRQSKRETYYATLPGRRIPTYCSSGGRAILSKLDDAAVDDILGRSTLAPLTPRTITDIGRIKEKIEEARVQNFSFAEEESLIGEFVLASAVVDRDGYPLGAVHIAGSRAEWAKADFIERFSPLAIEAARAIGTTR